MDHLDDPRSDLPARLPAGSSSPPAVWQDAPASSEAPTSLNARVLIRGIVRHWKLILGIWIVGSGAAVVVIQSRMKSSYQAVSRIEVDPIPNDIFAPTRSRDGADTYLRTQVELIKSPNVLSAALDDPKVSTFPIVRSSTDAESELTKRLLVRIEEGTNLIAVSLTSNIPSEASSLVDAVVGSYLKISHEWAESTTKKNITDLTNYSEELAAQKKLKAEELTNLANSGNIDLNDLKVGEKRIAEGSSKGGMMSITIEDYRRLRSEYLANSLELMGAETVYAQRRAEGRSTGRHEPTDADVDAAFQADPDVRALVAEVRSAQAKLDQVTSRSRKGSDPAGREARVRIESLTGQYEHLWQTREPQIRARLAVNAGDVGVAREREAEARVIALKAKKTSIDTMLTQLMITNKQQGGEAARAQFLMSDYNSIQEMSESVHKKLEALKYESRANARITLIHKARLPTVPLADLRKKLLVATPLILMASLLGLFALLEVRAARVTDPDEVSTRVRVRAFALPPLPAPKSSADGRRNRDHADQLAQYIQGVEHLRVALCGDGTSEQGRCVMITSATGGEGKTTLAAQLAGRCAAAGMSTLLIDCDLRRPSLGELLEVPEGAGLADVLADRATAEDALVVIGSGGGFHLLPAGSPVSDPGRLLQPHRIGPLLDRLRRSFDVVLIDTSPVLPVPDALCLGRCVDGAILATRFDASRYPLVERANRRLAEARIPVLGLIVNGVKSFGSFYNGYGYGGYAYTHVEPGGGAIES